MDTESELQNVLREYLEHNPGGDRGLAARFQVAPSTVRRWLTGIARPHPVVAQKIIHEIQNKQPG